MYVYLWVCMCVCVCVCVCVRAQKIMELTDVHLFFLLMTK